MQQAQYPSLQGRHVFISGGSSGIGAELVRQFASQGARVSFCSNEPEAARSVAAEVKRDTGHLPWVTDCDVTDIAAYQGVIASALAQVGPIDVLINNAGRDDRHALEDLTPEYWDDRLAVNLKHYVFAAQSVVPAMKAQGRGVILNMGSVSWMRGRANLVGYTSAKAAILGLTRTLARELGVHGIRVNAAVPGAIVTERQTALHRDPVADQAFLDAQCLKLRLDPGHVARLCLFLAADDSNGITGQHVLVDAGIAQQSVIA